MSLEVISKVLSPTNATYVNGVSAERRFSAAVLANLYQGLVEKDGKGVNDKFVSSADAEESAQVFVNRILPVKMKPREQGASKNGASFSENQHYTQTVTVGIELLTVLDDPIIIPRARQDMIKLDLLAEQTKIYSDRLKTILNGATFASKVLASYNVDKAKRNEITITASDVSNKLVLQRFIEGNSLLDEGDADNGIDIFPEDTRIAVFKTNYRATLKTSGILVIGGANYGYDIAKGNGISQGDTARKTEDGFIGEIDGVPCHIISNESLTHASEFLGFPANELKEGALVGYIASSYANARGVSTSKQTKVVDAQAGQGLVLQPYTKFGVISWYPKGNVLIASEEGYDPLADLKTLFTGKTIAWKLKGAGSRTFPVIPTGASFVVGATAFTLSDAVAKDSFDVDHVVGGYFYVGTTACKTVAEFLKNVKTATYKGEFTVGTEESTTIANKDYVNVLVIADDGSMAIASKQYNA